jgi:hypothetical protein
MAVDIQISEPPPSDNSSLARKWRADCDPDALQPRPTVLASTLPAWDRLYMCPYTGGENQLRSYLGIIDLTHVAVAASPAKAGSQSKAALKPRLRPFRKHAIDRLCATNLN